MASRNYGGQCTLELAIVALTLTAVILALAQVARAEVRAFTRTQLSDPHR
jgi:hypothetical protein